MFFSKEQLKSRLYKVNCPMCNKDVFIVDSEHFMNNPHSQSGLCPHCGQHATLSFVFNHFTINDDSDNNYAYVGKFRRASLADINIK